MPEIQKKQRAILFLVMLYLRTTRDIQFMVKPFNKKISLYFRIYNNNKMSELP